MGRTRKTRCTSYLDESALKVFERFNMNYTKALTLPMQLHVPLTKKDYPKDEVTKIH